MNFSEIGYNFLERLGKQTTLLAVFITLLFIEIAYHSTYGYSLISDNSPDLGKLVQFKFVMGFVVFIFACKAIYYVTLTFLYAFVSHYKKADNYNISYKLGFGAFLTSVLLLSHVFTTDDSNQFTSFFPDKVYQFICIVIMIFAFYISTLLWKNRSEN